MRLNINWMVEWEYFTQQIATTSTGQRFQPDVVIALPDGKKIIVDSKVTLTAYERYVNENEEEIKKQHLRDHILSITRHVDQLSAKNYFIFLSIKFK